MRKVALLISLVVVSAVAGGSFAYGWYSVTSIPTRDGQVEHHAHGQTDMDGASAFSEPAPLSRFEPRQSMEPTAQLSVPEQITIQQQLTNIAGENGQVSVTLDETQLNQFVNDAILSQPQAAQILANASSIRTMVRNDLIEMGAVLNLSELPRESLPTDIQAGLEQLTAVAPMLSNRDIYVGLVARPHIQDGKLSLDQDLRFKLGQFTLPLADVADQMGISAGDIEQRLNSMLNQQGLTLDSIEIVDEKLVITGTKP